jgi:3-hydroxy acid dehydrogenase/malonic semialdehyde reductase
MPSNYSYTAANRLDGKTILITGASSGIGRSVAFEFARTWPDNLRLILTARRLERLYSIAQEIVHEFGNGVKILPVALDVSNRDQIRAFVDSLPHDWRDINVLVNNA